MNQLDPEYRRELLAHVPANMIGGLLRYLEDGIEPGGFLQAVLKNDLKEACSRADLGNRYLIWEYVNALYNWAPSSAWGSPEKYNQWIAKHRHKGESNAT